MDAIIKRVLPEELSLLQSVGRQAFTETFAEWNTPENMVIYLEQSFNTERLSAELANNESEFYFALRNNEVIGYLKLNRLGAQTEIRDHDGVEIERIYVLKKYHGQKVGQLLFDTAMQRAQQAGAAYIWLGVWEKNEKAIKFYIRNGFIRFDSHTFKLGDEEQTDIMMKLGLKIS